jgi:hypothetical protein
MQPVHEYCRVKSAEDFKKKVAELESKPELADEIRATHYDMFVPNLFDGSFIEKVFTEAVKRYTLNKIETKYSSNYKKDSVLFPTPKTDINDLF